MGTGELSGLDDAIRGLRSQAEQLHGPVVEVLADLAEELERLRAVLVPAEALP